MQKKKYTNLSTILLSNNFKVKCDGQTNREPLRFIRIQLSKEGNNGFYLPIISHKLWGQFKETAILRVA